MCYPPRGWPRCSRSAWGAVTSDGVRHHQAVVCRWVAFPGRPRRPCRAGTRTARPAPPGPVAPGRLVAVGRRPDPPHGPAGPGARSWTTTTTVLCLLLGTPLAFLARSDHPAMGGGWSRAAWAAPVVGGVALLMTWGREWPGRPAPDGFRGPDPVHDGRRHPRRDVRGPAVLRDCRRGLDAGAGPSPRVRRADLGGERPALPANRGAAPRPAPASRAALAWARGWGVRGHADLRRQFPRSHPDGAPGRRCRLEQDPRSRSR